MNRTLRSEGGSVQEEWRKVHNDYCINSSHQLLLSGQLNLRVIK